MSQLQSTLLPHDHRDGDHHNGKLDAPPSAVYHSDRDMNADWTNDLGACRRSLRSAKRFAIVNAALEKWSLVTGYLTLIWATTVCKHVLLSGHVKDLDPWDFWIITAIVVIHGFRTVLVWSTSRLTQLWEAGSTNYSEGHILPLHGGGAPHGLFGSLKLGAVTVGCVLSIFRILALVRGRPFESGEPYHGSTLVPSVYMYYAGVLLEALILVAALLHRLYCMKYKKQLCLWRAAKKGSPHIADQALIWRLYARHVLDHCITGSIFDGMQCHYTAFLVKQAVFQWRRPQTASGHLSENLSPSPAQRQAAALVDALQDKGTVLERATIKWLLEHDEGIKYWHGVLTGSFSQPFDAEDDNP